MTKDFKHRTEPNNTATLVEKVEDAIRDKKPVTFEEKEELEALLERLICHLPDWGKDAAKPEAPSDLVKRDYYAVEAARIMRNERDKYRDNLIIPGIIDSPTLSPNDFWAVGLRSTERALRDSPNTADELKAVIQAWLDKEDATHFGQFELLLEKAISFEDCGGSFGECLDEDNCTRHGS